MASTTSAAADPRAANAHAWALAQLKLPTAAFAPASADASFRRYFRLESEGRSWVLMDAPPDQENCRPFVHVCKLLLAAGLNAPVIHAQDLQQGFLLLSDLGRQTFLNVLNDDNADGLFTDAIGALLRWQQASKPGELPEYDEALLRRELRLFPDWYVAHHLKTSFTPAQAQAWQSAEDHLVKAALGQPRVYVHRDYMPRNLMVSAPNPGVLDFQDAVYGPISYDVASLFRDAFVSWDEERVLDWTVRYWEKAKRAGLPVDADFGNFYRDLEWMGLQRHLKVLGIFARLHYRDGKRNYLEDTPRFMGYVRAVAVRYNALKPLLVLLDEIEGKAEASAGYTF